MIRNNPELAAASGVPVTRLKILTLRRVGHDRRPRRGLLRGLYGYVIPEDVFTTNWSVLPLAVAILGGMDTTLGPIIGAVVLRCWKRRRGMSSAAPATRSSMAR